MASLDELTDPAAMKSRTPADKLYWAKQYGRKLHEIHGDPEIIAEMDDEEANEDKKKAWSVVRQENSNRIEADVDEVASTDSQRDNLLQAIKLGFESDYEETREERQ